MVWRAIRKTRIFYQFIRRASEWNDRFPILGKSVFTLREIPGQTIFLDTPEVRSPMADAKIVFVHGWRIRAPGSVRWQADKIREYLRPIAGIEAAGWQVMERLRQVAEVIIGVHLRQGDYRTWKQGQYFFPPERDATWMRELAGQFPGCKAAFFVCSDEPRQASEFPGLTIVIGAGPPVVDLYSLAGCDYVLGLPSTFSQWASFYGNKSLYHLRDHDTQIELDKSAVSDLSEIPL